jgi:rhamnulokinase
MDVASCAAVDLGASSGRVVVAESDGRRIALREAARFETPVLKGEHGYQCWDIDAIEARVREGLRAAQAMATLASVGVDTWGVDFVLLDEAGARAAPVVSYRDPRTQQAMRRVLARMPAEEIYRRTGIQFQPFNTLFQLAATAEREPAWLARARRLLMLPDYLHYRLCGALSNEYTETTTTQLWSIDADDWDDELLAMAGISRSLLGRPVEPGTPLGTADLASGRVQVIAPATHDTAASVAAIPLEDADTAYISSGTWSLMGIESAVPLASEAARRLNVTNEGGVERRYRVLRNLAGLWLVQRIRQELGGEDHAALVDAAGAAPPWRSLVDPEDPRFFNPGSMIEAIRGFCAETGQPEPADGGALARCAFESLALAYRRVARELSALRGRPLARIHVAGGGSRNRLLNQLCADACALPVRAGPVETAALGNACVQLIALGVLPDLAAARALVRRSFELEDFGPRQGVPVEAVERFEGFSARQVAGRGKES